MKMHGNLNMGSRVSTDGLIGRFVLCDKPGYDPKYRYQVLDVNEVDQTAMIQPQIWIEIRYLRYA